MVLKGGEAYNGLRAALLDAFDVVDLVADEFEEAGNDLARGASSDQGGGDVGLELHALGAGRRPQRRRPQTALCTTRPSSSSGTNAISTRSVRARSDQVLGHAVLPAGRD
jgi:hypothetical protein